MKIIALRAAISFFIPHSSFDISVLVRAQKPK